MIVIWSVIGVLAVLCAAAFLMHLRFEGATPADVPSAKAAGDTLLALRDTTVLVVLAHPDDAEWWSGGTIASLALHNKVVLVLGTSGDKDASGCSARATRCWATATTSSCDTPTRGLRTQRAIPTRSSL